VLGDFPNAPVLERQGEKILLHVRTFGTRCLLRAAAALALFAVFTFAGARASAQDDYRISGVRPEVHFSLGGHGDLGAGFRLDIPIVPDGFLRNNRDDFALSPGMDIQFYDLGHDDDDGDRVLLIPQLAAQWNIYFPRAAWSIFPEAGVAVVVGDWAGNDNVHADPLFAFGARKHFNSRTALLLRAGWPTGFQIGVAF
jgi:hypothetical protein